MTTFARAMIVAAAAAGAAGCTDFGDPIRQPVGMVAPRFFTDVAPIFSSNCAISGCHAPPVQAGLDLRASVAYANIVDVASTENPALRRIAPGDPDNSYLLRKLSDCAGCYVGARMPFGRPPLPDAQLQLLRDWVAAGAAP